MVVGAVIPGFPVSHGQARSLDAGGRLATGWIAGATHLRLAGRSGYGATDRLLAVAGLADAVSILGALLPGEPRKLRIAGGDGPAVERRAEELRAAGIDSEHWTTLFGEPLRRRKRLALERGGASVATGTLAGLRIAARARVQQAKEQDRRRETRTAMVDEHDRQAAVFRATGRGSAVPAALAARIKKGRAEC